MILGASWLKAIEGGVEVAIVAAPRASKTRVVGEHGDRLKVQLAAPPVDGEANAALLELFVELFCVSRSAVELVDGQTGKRKRLRIHGVTVERASEILKP